MRGFLLLASVAATVTAVPLGLEPEAEVVDAGRHFPSLREDAEGGEPSHDHAIFAITVPRIRFNLGDFFNNPFGFFGNNGAPGFSGLFPSTAAESGPDCDLGTFDLTEQEFDVLSQCQLKHAEDDQLKACIVEGLPETSTEVRQFLDREEFSLSGIKTSFAIAASDGEVEKKRSVSFRMCPKDEINSIDTSTGPEAAGVPLIDRGEVATETGSAPDGSSASPQRPVFQFPVFNLPEFTFPDITKLFAPFLPSRPVAPGEEGEQGGNESGLFPLFPVPSFPDVSTDLDNCASESFRLPREAFNTAKACRFADIPMEECLAKELEGNEDAKDLMAFLSDDRHVIVSTSFYSSVVLVDGEIDRVNKLRVTRCLKSEEVPAEGEGEGEGEVPQPGAGQSAAEEQEQEPETEPTSSTLSTTTTTTTTTTSSDGVVEP